MLDWLILLVHFSCPSVIGNIISIWYWERHAWFPYQIPTHTAALGVIAPHDCPKDIQNSKHCVYAEFSATRGELHACLVFLINMVDLSINCEKGRGHSI